ncbi:hypothetical protein CHS0354_016408 [Potamilus streckersoni]|uniref:CRESS-DNA virus Rep endonuclease domain-containing protein n=1 Tax=Potamilus streckersoni TaxID=2493646 RepID=A0AAE0W2K9_9BIVA|nr:hypothetical protein CHS0354_016408 [Potamilus streckersoni]
MFVLNVDENIVIGTPKMHLVKKQGLHYQQYQKALSQETGTSSSAISDGGSERDSRTPEALNREYINGLYIQQPKPTTENIKGEMEAWLEKIVFAICGNKVEKNNTPYIQGLLHLVRRIRRATLEKLIGSRVHLEVARGTDQQNEKYCSKGGNVFIKTGVPQSGDKEGGVKLQSSKDVRHLLKCSQRDSWTSILEENPDVIPEVVRHFKSIKTLANIMHKDDLAKNLQNELSGIIYWNWQHDVRRICLEKPHPRRVHWYWDYNGLTGKTF